MARRKTRRSGAGRPTAGSAIMDGWWNRLSAPTKLVLRKMVVHAMLLGLLAGVVVFGLRALDRRVHRMDRYAGDVTLLLAEPPQCLSAFPDLHQDLKDVICNTIAQERQAAAADQSNSLWFDNRLAIRIAEVAAANPFVARVARVSKQIDGPAGDGKQFVRRVVVELEYRRPEAVFSDRRHYRCWVLDGDGVVLAERDMAQPVPNLPVVFSNNRRLSFARPVVGRKLDVPDVQAGLDLLRLLASQPYAGEVRERGMVDVTNFGRRQNPMASELVLVVRPPAGVSGPPQEIGWGIRPSSKEAGDNGTPFKLGHLITIWEWRKDRPNTLWRVRELGSSYVDIFSRPNELVKGPPLDPAAGGVVGGSQG